MCNPLTPKQKQNHFYDIIHRPHCKRQSTAEVMTCQDVVFISSANGWCLAKATSALLKEVGGLMAQDVTAC